MPFYNAASLDAANETTVPLDTADLFSGSGRYPAKLGAVCEPALIAATSCAFCSPL